MLLKVNTIYPAFMGEVNKFGIGAKCTFLRLAGCNIRCYKKTMLHLCDTPESLEGEDGEEMSVNDILEVLDGFENDLICLTGGEPLMQKPLELLETLSKKGYKVVVETNGTVPIDSYRNIQNVSFVIDYKAISTGENGLFRKSNFNLMDSDDYLKFVINDWADYKQMLDLYDNVKLGELPDINFAAGLFWGSEIGYQELMAKIIKDRLNVTLNMQVHKMAVMYDAQREDAKSFFIPRNL